MKDIDKQTEDPKVEFTCNPEFKKVLEEGAAKAGMDLGTFVLLLVRKAVYEKL